MNLRQKFSGIRSRLLIISIAPILIVAAALSFSSLSTSTDMLNRSLADSGESTAIFMASTAELSMYAEDRATLESLGRSALRLPSLAGVGFINSSNHLIAVTGDKQLMNAAYIKPCIQQGSFDSNDYLHICKPIIGSTRDFSDFGSQEQGEENVAPEHYGWVVLAISREALFAQVRSNIYIIGSVTLGVVVIVSILALRIGRSISAPVLSLEKTVKDLGKGNYESHAEEAGPIETRALAKGINSLATAVATSQEQLEQKVKNATRQLTLALKNITDKNTDLEQAQQDLKSAMAAKDQFLARMSHELRTPLTAVTGFSRLLHQSDMDETQTQYSENIIAASELLMGTIDSILDFSKLQEQALPIEIIDFDLREAMESLVAMQAYQAHSKSLELVLIIDPDVPVQLQGDPTRIKQVINNLLSNAIKFTDQGEVILHISVIKDSKEKTRLSLQVKDSGIGIDSESQNRLFQPFSQADDSITRRFGGTGLGLVICKQLLELMNGSIHISSEPNKGSTFYVELPLAKSNNTPNTKPESTSYNKCGEKPLADDKHNTVIQHLKDLNILIAEDNPYNQQLIKSILELLGAHVITADNGEQAIVQFQQHAVDIVLMDIHMPVMDGITATVQISELAGDEGIPIIGLTANIMDNERQTLMQAGAADILFKPLDEQQLIATITELVGRTPIKNTLEDNKQTSGLMQSVASKETLQQELNRLLQKLEQAITEKKRQAAAEIIHEMQGLSGIFGTEEVTTAINTLHVTLKADSASNRTTTLIENIKITINNL